MRHAIKELCEDKRNIVFVVSGKERHSLTNTLGEIPNLGLAAEHGMFISWPVPSNKMSAHKRRWETLVPETDNSWRSLAISIMEVYTSRTHGSYTEETEMKVLWQYRDADPEFGYLQAKELEDHLSNVLRNFAVDILHGGVEEGGYVEVRPKGVNKGVLATHVLRHVPNVSEKKAKVDFALVLGDDHCDEPMLSVLRQIGRRVQAAKRAKRGEDPLPELPPGITQVDVSSCDNFISPDLQVFTCTVGKKPSAAASYLNEVGEVQELIESLVKVSTRDHKFYSSVDLTSFGSKSRNPSEGLKLTSNIEIMNTGLTKSRSLSQMSSSSIPSRAEVKVSNSLSAYLGMNSIDDDTAEEDDDDAFFF
jgi:trehalose 6-phosphate synthase/phosphatase